MFDAERRGEVVLFADRGGFVDFFEGTLNELDMLL